MGSKSAGMSTTSLVFTGNLSLQIAHRRCGWLLFLITSTLICHSIGIDVMRSIAWGVRLTTDLDSLLLLHSSVIVSVSATTSHVSFARESFCAKTPCALCNYMFLALMCYGGKMGL